LTLITIFNLIIRCGQIVFAICNPKSRFPTGCLLDPSTPLQNERDAAFISIGARTHEAATQAGWIGALRQRLQTLSLNQKVGFGSGLLAMVLAVVLALNSARFDPNYKVLFSNLSDADGASIVAALQQMNVPYEFTPGGGAIMVPQDQVYEVRLKLAGQGLPKAGNVGYELLENQKFGTSQFVERVNYLRGLEGELARSVASLSQVKSARVHLAVPKQTAFVREQEPATASVVVTMHPGRVLSPEQVAAIARLVSSSVPGMKAQDVAVLDTEGGMLNPNTSRLAGLDATQLKYTADVEAAFTRRVMAILEPLAGKDGFRAQVSVDLNFDEIERTSETYAKNSAPNSQSIRSQQSKESGNGATGPAGVPGALSNQPPDPPEAPIVNATSNGGSRNSPRSLRAPGEIEAGVAVIDHHDSHKKEQTVNYELDRVIEHLKTTKGQIRRVSAAVLMDHKPVKNSGDVQLSGSKVPFSPQELQQINNLVKEAIGYVKERGDTVSVANLAFSEEPAVEASVVTPDLLSQLLRYGAVALAVLFAYFALLRPLIQSVKPAAAKLEPSLDGKDPGLTPNSSAELMRKQLQEQQEAWEIEQERLKAQKQREAMQSQQAAEAVRELEIASKKKYDELVQYASVYAREQSGDAALLLRAWLSEPPATPVQSGERS
jgi:flagellar M-ring protein FliF